MASPPKDVFIRHRFAGGWATDFGPAAAVVITPEKVVEVPWLNDAVNVFYELDGGPHKIPGATKLNSTVLESAAAVTGVCDAWFSTTTGTAVQHRIVHVGTKIKRDAADGTFTDLFTGMTAGSMMCCSMLEDLLIISNDSGSDVPKSWDRTTAQNLAGSPPTFAFSVRHKNRVWASGAIAQPSRLYYSVNLDGADWAGSGSGSIDIDPDDGDRITGIISHRNELWVFKGPYKGSIHRITGSAPTGTDAYARVSFADSIGAGGDHVIVEYGNDLAFMWSDGTIRSLSMTERFGDYLENSLSQPINTWIRDHVTKSSIHHAAAVNWPEYGLLLFAVPIDASTTPNCIMMCDYRFTPVRWSLWSAYDMVRSLARGVDVSSSHRRIILAGCDDGFVRIIGSPNRSIDTTDAISYSWTTPYLDYGLPVNMKTLEGASLRFLPHNSGSVTFGWARDNNAQQTVTISQQGSDAVLGSFELDVDRLGGNNLIETFSRLGEEGGEFRSVQFSTSNSVADEDVQIHAFGVKFVVGAESFENTA